MCPGWGGAFREQARSLCYWCAVGSGCDLAPRPRPGVRTRAAGLRNRETGRSGTREAGGCRVDLAPAIRGDPHDDVTGAGGARNAGRTGRRGRLWLPGAAPGQAFHDREGFRIRRKITCMVSVATARIMRRCFISAGYRVDLPPAIRGVNPHDDVTGHEGAQNAGRMSPAEADVTSGHGPGPGISWSRRGFSSPRLKTLRDHGNATGNAASPSAPSGYE